MKQNEHSEIPKLIGVLGGTITATDADLGETTESPLTPFGHASAPVQNIDIGQTNVAFIARHGVPRAIAPHDINYRANLWTLYKAPVSAIIAMYAVGAIENDLAVGDIVIPDQIIDYTWDREGFFNATLGLNHYDFSEPFDPVVRRHLISSAQETGNSISNTGTYACTQGPRLETSAEIDRFGRDGCNLVGMTAMPEAALARELNIPFGGICLIVTAAAGRGVGPIQHHEINLAIEHNSGTLLNIVGRAARGLQDIAY